MAESQEATTISGPPFIKMRALGEGITGIAESVIYVPVENLHPVGLGRWVQQRSDLEVEFPPSPGHWIKQPTSPEFMVLKLPRRTGNTQIYGQLSAERNALLRIQDAFAENAVARPARLFGYGVRRRTGEPYLILEDVSKFGESKRLDEYLASKGHLSEQEALEVAIRIAFVLTKAHARDIIYGDINDQKLDNVFWNPQKKYLRLIDWANSASPLRTSRLGLRVSISSGHDREGLALLLVRLITGKFSVRRTEITREDWVKMSQPTRDVVARAFHLRPKDSYDPFKPAETDRMLADLQTAYKMVS